MKAQLVDAIRMLERAGIIDHNGHCSARRDAGAFYINSGASVRGALDVGDIVTVHATDPASAIDIRHFCNITENPLIDSSIDGDVYTYVIRKDAP